MSEQTDPTKPSLSRRQARRIRRADELQRRTLSPVRILLKVLGLPVLAAGIGLSAYVRTSDYEPGDAMRHLVALGGCSSAKAVGLANARKGELGYHPRNDTDGDGVACSAVPLQQAARTAPATAARSAGGAKFIKP